MTVNRKFNYVIYKHFSRACMKGARRRGRSCQQNVVSLAATTLLILLESPPLSGQRFKSSCPTTTARHVSVQAFWSC